jgi:hypothetical protein
MPTVPPGQTTATLYGPSRRPRPIDRRIEDVRSAKHRGRPVCTSDDVARCALGNYGQPITLYGQRAATVQGVGKYGQPTIDRFNRP